MKREPKTPPIITLTAARKFNSSARRLSMPT